MLVSLSPRDNNHLHFGVYLSSFFFCVYVCVHMHKVLHRATSTCRHI